MLGPLERYITHKLDAALLCSSRAGSDLGHKSDRFEVHTHIHSHMYMRGNRQRRYGTLSMHTFANSVKKLDEPAANLCSMIDINSFLASSDFR